MDSSFTAEEIDFQLEVREFLAQAWTDDIAKAFKEEIYKGEVMWERKLNAKGWLAPHWPKEHGGTGWSTTEKYIFNCELARCGARSPLNLGLSLLAPVLYTFGSTEQKERFLPRILSGDDWWCQGYSEPGAGSDLASLKTRAVREGDEYVVNGTKIWTSFAQYANWIFCLVRTADTEKKQNGISFLLIDMNTEGIEVSPIISIDNRHHLNQVTFTDVRVPVANRIGEENKGWTYAKALLEHERLSIAYVPESKLALAQAVEAAKKISHKGRPLLEDISFQNRLSDIETELMAHEFTLLRVLDAISSGKTPGLEASILKIKGSEIQQSLHELHMDIAGYYGAILRHDKAAAMNGHGFGILAREEYFFGKAVSIYGGTNEVQKNIIAKYVLGL